METLECQAVPSRSRGAVAPEPSNNRERQRRRRATLAVHQRDDEHRGNVDLLRSARARQTADERDARRRKNTESRRSARVLQTADERDAGAARILSRGGLLVFDSRLMRVTEATGDEAADAESDADGWRTCTRTEDEKARVLECCHAGMEGSFACQVHVVAQMPSL